MIYMHLNRDSFIIFFYCEKASGLSPPLPSYADGATCFFFRIDKPDQFTYNILW